MFSFIKFAGLLEINEPDAPLSNASPIKSWPSKLGPRKAINKSPGLSVLESIEMPEALQFELEVLPTASAISLANPAAAALDGPGLAD